MRGPVENKVGWVAVVLGSLLAVVMGLAVACGDSDSEEALSTEATIAASLPELSAEDAAAVRALADAYWAAWNAYDVDKVLSMLEEPFRSQRGEEIKGNIEKLRRWRMSISVTEATSPRIGPDGEVVMYVNVKKPLSTDLTQMRFKKTGSSWVITYASKD